MSSYTFVAPCLMGVESLVADELRAQGLTEVRSENGRVLFTGDETAMARACLWSRCAERVLLQLGQFPARSFEELFQGVLSLPLEEWIGQKDAFPVTGSCLNSQLHSVPDCQKIIKKAAVERLRRTYRVSWFEETGYVHPIRFLLLKDQCSVMLDVTGVPLHKRGYRRDSVEAPIKETLAASLCAISRLRHDGTLIDPFCGSGTILIEGAMMAKNIAPGLSRSFAAEHWRQCHESVWKEERERARAMQRNDTGFQAYGYDIDPAAVELATQNAAGAGLSDCIQVAVRDIRDFRQETPFGCVITNPPYGERLLDREQARELYRQMGRVFVPQRGWSYAIIAPDEEFEMLFGRRADKRRKLYNGMIKCQDYLFYRTGPAPAPQPRREIPRREKAPMGQNRRPGDRPGDKPGDRFPGSNAGEKKNPAFHKDEKFRKDGRFDKNPDFGKPAAFDTNKSFYKNAGFDRNARFDKKAASTRHPASGQNGKDRREK